jgi:eukaryotic-like serine/threonine-protein kinase
VAAGDQGSSRPRQAGDATVQPGALTGLLARLAAAPERPGEVGYRPGDVAGRFELVREVGRGGFGVVFEARDRELGRSVAFKAIRPGPTDALREQRLVQEAEASARLSHPGIVTLFDVGHGEPGPYLVFELLRGEPLSARLARGPVPVDEALRVVTEVAQALAYAHQHGVIHRDLKPGNVFCCDDGRVKVLDFGLAHAFGRRRESGGTPAYMAPEQWRGAPEDERTDIFALGVLLFELLTGTLPFPGDDGGRAATSSRAAPGLDVPDRPELGDLIARMLAKDPVERPRDGAEVLVALQALAGGAPVPAGPPRPGRPVRRRPRRWFRVGSVALVGLALGALAALLVGRWQVSGRAGGRPLVAVTDVVNATGDGELDGLSGLLITSLEQSRRIAVLTRSRLADLAVQAGRPAEARIDERLGRELGRSAGVKAVLVAAVHRLGEVYTVELRAVAPSRDDYLFTLSERAAGKSALPELVDRLAGRARQELDEGEAEIAGHRIEVGKAVTGSLEAYQNYFRGVELFEAHDFEGALAAFRRALAVDPDMALAHVWLAFMANYHTAGGEEAGPHLEAAARAASSLPEKERRFVEALAAGESNRYEEAEVAVRRLATDYPQDKVVLWFAGHFTVGAEKEAFYRRALALDPAYPWPLYQLLYMLPRSGRAAEALVLAERAVALRPGFPTWFNLGLARGHAGDFEGALAAARKAQGLGPPRFQAAILEALSLASLGRPDEGLAVIVPWTRPGVPEPSRHPGLAGRGMLEALAGRRAEALRTFAAANAIRGDDMGRNFLVHAAEVGGDTARARQAALAWPDPWASEAGWLERLGLAERAAALATELPPGSGAEVQYRAAMAERAGRRDEAIRLMKEALAATPESSEAYLLGRALAAAGRCAEALPELDRVARLFPWPWDQQTVLAVRLPLSLLEAAQCLEQMGRPAEAKGRLARLRRLWVHADADLPALVEVAALEARLR